jgi:hypothetical protein
MMKLPKAEQNPAYDVISIIEALLAPRPFKDGFT